MHIAPHPAFYKLFCNSFGSLNRSVVWNVKCPLDYITFCREDSFWKIISAAKYKTTVKNFDSLLPFSGFYKFLNKCDCSNIQIILSNDNYATIGGR